MNENRSAELLADIAAREARMLDGGVDEWQSPDERPQRMVRRTYEQPQQQDWSGWDRWASAHVERALAAQPVFSKAQVSAIGQALSEIRAELRKEFAEQLGSLRADNEILRSIVSGKTVEIKRDAA